MSRDLEGNLAQLPCHLSHLYVSGSTCRVCQACSWISHLFRSHLPNGKVPQLQNSGEPHSGRGPRQAFFYRAAPCMGTWTCVAALLCPNKQPKHESWL